MSKLTTSAKKIVDGNECLDAPDDEHWAIERHSGALRSTVDVPRTAEVCRGMEQSVEVPAPLPGVTTATTAIGRDFQGFVDALVSPSAGVVHGKRATVFIDQKKKRDASLKANVMSVVMAEWAIGNANISRWKREAKAALRP